MPYESQAQWKKFRVLEAEGKLKKGTSSRWAHESKSYRSLPKHKRKKRRRSTR